MATRLSTAARSAAVTAITGLADAGSGAATIAIYSGTQPATADTAPSGTLLGTLTLDDPAYEAASPGAAAMAGMPRTATGVADGTAGWFRLRDSSGATVIDGSVTATGDGGQIELATTTISTGLTIELTSATITMPAG